MAAFLAEVSTDGLKARQSVHHPPTFWALGGSTAKSAVGRGGIRRHDER